MGFDQIWGHPEFLGPNINLPKILYWICILETYSQGQNADGPMFTNTNGFFSLSLCSAATSYAAGLETLEVHCAATAAFFLQHNIL